MLVHRVIALDVLSIGQMCSKYLLSSRMVEYDEHFIGPEESGEPVHDHGQAFGLDDQQMYHHQTNNFLSLCKDLDHLRLMRRFL